MCTKIVKKYGQEINLKNLFKNSKNYILFKYKYYTNINILYKCIPAYQAYHYIGMLKKGKAQIALHTFMIFITYFFICSFITF